MKYVKIKNNGHIEPQAIYLVGASSKINDASKIGQFGSGNKYALAYLLRNDYDVQIFAGKTEIQINTQPETFRENIYNVIYVNGEKTSITTEMGKDWQFWQAIREIYCNAIDEGGSTIELVNEIAPIENETHFYIDMKKDVSEFFANFDNYFATNKKVLFECKDGRILEKSGSNANIYRKGIRCFNSNMESVFDYDFANIEIEESRIVKYRWHVEEKIWKLIYQCDNEELIMQILANCSDDNYIESEVADYSNVNSGNMSEAFKKCLKKINVAPIGFAGLLKPDEVHNFLLLPTKIYSSVKGVLGSENVGKRFDITKKGAIYRIVEPNELQEASIQKAIDFLNECNFSITYPIKSAIFDDKSTLGTVNNDTIILSDICLEKGANEIANTIIEEYIHIKYDVSDETRGFQTAMITEFISYMKKVNAYAI